MPENFSEMAERRHGSNFAWAFAWQSGQASVMARRGQILWLKNTQHATPSKALICISTTYSTQKTPLKNQIKSYFLRRY
jgi:hypothetical protein